MPEGIRFLLRIAYFAAWEPNEKISKLEISKLEIKEGDILLVRVKDTETPLAILEDIKNELYKIFENRVVFLLGDIEVSVVTLESLKKKRPTYSNG